MIISVVEHQKIRIRGHRNEDPACITLEDAERLEKLFSNDVPVFVRRGNYITTQQWVGVVDLPGLSIEILPKISGGYSKAQLRHIVSYMICIANNIPYSNFVPGSVSAGKYGLQDLLIFNYIELLKAYVKDGLLSDYAKTTREQPVIKGKINFQKQFASGEQFPTKFTCTYSRYQQDIKLNRVLLCALEQMILSSENAGIVRELASLRNFFDGVTLVQPETAKTYQVTFNMINSRAQEVFALAKMYLEHIAFHYDAGQNKVHLMLFDMNALFERFIYQSYRRMLGGHVRYQYNSQCLLENKEGKYVRMRPDIIIRTDNGIQILDTKWRNTSGVPQKADTYQMNAYGTSFKNVTSIHLLYPLSQKLSESKWSYEFNVYCVSKPDLIVNMVDLGLCFNRDDFQQSLLDIIDDNKSSS